MNVHDGRIVFDGLTRIVEEARVPTVQGLYDHPGADLIDLPSVDFHGLVDEVDLGFRERLATELSLCHVPEQGGNLSEPLEVFDDPLPRALVETGGCILAPLGEGDERLEELGIRLDVRV